jgi:hypothetical protein
MASSGIILECLLVSQSFTMPGVILLWQPIQVLVAGLSGISFVASGFSSAAKTADKKDIEKSNEKNKMNLDNFISGSLFT